MANETALISGAGIAGPTLSYWLARAGWKPTIVESAPSIRTGGYVIDFWGLGYDIADRMELCEDLDRLGYHMREMRIVDDEGKRKTGLGTNVFREITGGRFVTVRRSDLARLLLEKAKLVTENFLRLFVCFQYRDAERSRIDERRRHKIGRPNELARQRARRQRSLPTPILGPPSTKHQKCGHPPHVRTVARNRIKPTSCRAHHLPPASRQA